MKYAILTLSLFGLFSCSTVKKTKISKSGYSLRNMEGDILENESLLRYNNSKFQKLSKTSTEKIKLVVQCHNKKYDAAKKLQQRSFEKSKSDPEYWNQIGNCYLYQNDYEKAEFFYNKSFGVAESQKKAYAPVLNNLGVIALKQNDYSRAFTLFNQAKEKDESLTAPIYNLALLHLEFYNYEKSQELLEQLLTMAPKDPTVKSSLGKASLISGDYKKAEGYFTDIDLNTFGELQLRQAHALNSYYLGQYERAAKIMTVRGRKISSKNKMTQVIQSMIDKKLQEVSTKKATPAKK